MPWFNLKENLVDEFNDAFNVLLVDGFYGGLHVF
jgi:hypothetical protein